jgi:type II secretory pathway component PulK
MKPNWLTKQRKLKNERGVALLMVLLMLTLVGSVVADFQFNAGVDLQLAVNARDELQAEYNAMSALRLRAMVLKHSRALQGVIDGLLGPLLGEGVKIPFAQILESIPIECSMLSAIMKRGDTAFPEDKDEEGEEDTPDLFQGECMATSTSEHSKISINALANPTNQPQQVVALLGAMLSDTHFERHFEEDDKTGGHAESPAELIGNIVDWIDGDNDQLVSTSSDEERPYAFLKERYRPKNAPFDSLAELQMVAGIDDELFQLISKNVSIYSNSRQIELSTAKDGQIVMGMMASLKPGITLPDGVLGVMFLKLQELRAATFGFLPLTKVILKTFATEALGDALDNQRFDQAFSDKAEPPTWYTIEATGAMGNATRKIRAVFQAQEGQFYYVRVE